MATIAVIDDDLAMDILTENLRYRGHEAFRICSADEALRKIKRLASTDLIVLDIIMPWPSETKKRELTGSHNAGMEVFREIRVTNPEIPIIVYSATQDASLISVLLDDPTTTFLPKFEAYSIRDLVSLIHKRLGQEEAQLLPTPFIVHGRNKTEKLALKNYLQNTLHFPEPIILHEQPNLGQTIIEKFEEYAARSSFVFVLLTPDDLDANPDDNNEEKRRARQNVIFEMGYFLGTLGRESGRVILLYLGPLELPSDLAGVVYIDISKGIESASEEIRREIENVK